MTRGIAILLMAVFVPHLLKGEETDTLRIGPSHTIKTIKAGINKASHGDVLLVEKAVYKEGTIRIDKPITILGLNFPVVDGEFKNEILQITADSVRITGLQIQNVGISYTKDQAGISGEKVTHCVIDNNVLLNTFLVFI